MTDDTQLTEQMFKTTPRHAYSMIVDILDAGLVPFLKASPGVGKSSIVRQIAKDFSLKLIDHRLSTSPPWDLSGLPKFFTGANGIERARYAPLEIFPLEDDPIPEGYNGWILFFDEFNSAKKDTQAASYKTILDKMTALHKLHEKCMIVAAGNLDTDRAIVTSLSTAMQSRLVTIEIVFNFEEWIADIVLPQQWDPRVVAFLHAFPKTANDFRADHDENTFCCPRTWDFLQRLVKGKPITKAKIPMYAGTITAGVAVDFTTFSISLSDDEDPLPKIKDIVHDPDGCRIPPEKNKRYGLITMAWQHITDDNFEAISKYMNRMDSDFQILFYRGALKQKPGVRSKPSFQDAIVRLHKYLNEY